ncbi:MAG: hypothetical protein M3P47_02240 [Pseudomonadota bacterium]|nr:hypothetical protein [Pseudomonadota bacterium]
MRNAGLAMLCTMAMLAAGCAMQRGTAATPYAQMGGPAGTEAIVDDLLVKIVDDDRINFQFAETDEQLCLEAGGPCT